MNMTSEFTIAVHALVFLNHKKESKSSEELAKNVCTHPARIRKVMARLKKAGLVKTKEGIDGGYSFDLDPGCVTLRDKMCIRDSAYDARAAYARRGSHEPEPQKRRSSVV